MQSVIFAELVFSRQGVGRGWVHAVTVYNGDLIAGGEFTWAGAYQVNYISRWDGTNWQPLGTGMNAEVDALTVYNGELIAGGRFMSAGGVEAKFVARWDRDRMAGCVRRT